MQRFRRAPAARRAIASHSGNAYLHTYVPETFVHPTFSGFDHLGNLRSVDVRVGVGSFPALAPSKLINGHSRLTAFDVPKRLIDPADGVVQHGAVFPIGTVITGLPDVLDPVRRLIQEEWPEILLDRGLDQIRALGEGGAPVAVQSVLVGCDLYHAEPHAFGLAFNHAEVFDARHGHGMRGSRCLFLSPNAQRPGTQEQARARNGFQETPTLYRH